jgi:hypothetical protein
MFLRSLKFRNFPRGFQPYTVIAGVLQRFRNSGFRWFLAGSGTEGDPETEAGFWRFSGLPRSAWGRASWAPGRALGGDPDGPRALD